VLHWIHELLPHFPRFGYVLVFVVVLLNNLGLPLPGDTIVLGAGFILGKNAFSLWEPMAAATAACFLGGIWAFWIGRRLGYSGIEKIRWLHLTPTRVRWGQHFFKEHGPKTVFFARFIILFPPFAANALAGMAKMRWAPFLLYNITGSAAYSVSYILIGYFFGKRWNAFRIWLGPEPVFWIAPAVVLVALLVIFHQAEYKLIARLFAPVGRSRGRS